MESFLEEVLSNVFQFCPASTIHCNLSLVCKRWHRTVESAPHRFWYEVYASQFPYCETSANWEEWKQAEIVKDAGSHLWSCGCLERESVSGWGPRKDFLPFRVHQHRIPDSEWRTALKERVLATYLARAVKDVQFSAMVEVNDCEPWDYQTHVLPFYIRQEYFLNERVDNQFVQFFLQEPYSYYEKFLRRLRDFFHQNKPVYLRNGYRDDDFQSELSFQSQNFDELYDDYLFVNNKDGKSYGNGEERYDIQKYDAQAWKSLARSYSTSSSSEADFGEEEYDSESEEANGGENIVVEGATNEEDIGMDVEGEQVESEDELTALQHEIDWLKKDALTFPVRTKATRLTEVAVPNDNLDGAGADGSAGKMEIISQIEKLEQAKAEKENERMCAWIKQHADLARRTDLALGVDLADYEKKFGPEKLGDLLAFRRAEELFCVFSPPGSLPHFVTSSMYRVFYEEDRLSAFFAFTETLSGSMIGFSTTFCSRRIPGLPCKEKGMPATDYGFV